MPLTESDYTAMQKSFYEAETPRMSEANHSEHNTNPHYWSILLAPLNDGDWSEKVVLDFGCGCGRSVENILNKWTVKEIHGCDISQNNIDYCHKHLPTVTTHTNYKFFVTDGQSLQPAESDAYDLIVSTIVLQHIPVYNIRKKILTDMHRCLKPGGTLSIQMGYGAAPLTFSDYYDNTINARATNGFHDTRVARPEQLGNDLRDIGFTAIRLSIRKSWTDSHTQWIYATAIKGV